MNENRREPGQVVSLTDGEHFKTYLGQILSALIVGGIVSTIIIYSQVNVNTKDISRHEQTIGTLSSTLDRIETKVDTLIGQANGRQEQK